MFQNVKSSAAERRVSIFVWLSDQAQIQALYKIMHKTASSLYRVRLKDVDRDKHRTAKSTLVINVVRQKLHKIAIVILKKMALPISIKTKKKPAIKTVMAGFFLKFVL